MSDKEAIEEICNMTSHNWIEEYYGLKCQNCGQFIPYGCEPWLPLDYDPPAPGEFLDIDSDGDYV